ncbi:acyl-CoA carboxylase subunit beta [Streptomyces sp. NBC_01304]|uniref:acyl-CoA carboxylase subunit beta n=1 Tax=Streptomyces sp. NBC_01304 TaxID=2903818 RepID=UPI002E0DCF9F|nr:acyl-CoA carboxylase subunit beta [Streptomyces sp. NBC_01304]
MTEVEEPAIVADTVRRPVAPSPVAPSPLPAAPPSEAPAPAVFTEQDDGPPESALRAAELRWVKDEIAAGPDIAPGPAPTPTKLTARERIALLLDDGSFTETEPLRRHRATAFGLADDRPYTDGVVTGWGTVEGRTVFLYAHDARIFQGALGEAHAQKIHKVMDRAEAAGAPLVSLCDSAGPRLLEGVASLAQYGGIFRRNARASGVIPQISVVLGACAGGASYSPALTDFVFMVEGLAQLVVTDPENVESATGARTTAEDLGGTGVHTTTSGVAGFAYEDEETCLVAVRRLIGLLPSNNREFPPAVPSADPPDRRCEALIDLVPADPRQPYDMRTVIAEIVDDGALFEVHEQWATNVVCALVRLDGEVTGIVASQPQSLAGALDAHGSLKAAKFVSTCDSFNIPLVTLVDVPGFLPGVEQELGGLLRHGAHLLYAYCNATVPRVSVVLRKAYGGAYVVMDSRSVGADLAFAWPANEIAARGAGQAVADAFRQELADAEDPAALRAQLTRQYEDELMHPYRAAEQGLVDDVIDPAETRDVLVRSLAMLRAKQEDVPSRKHGNPPL